MGFLTNWRFISLFVIIVSPVLLFHQDFFPSSNRWLSLSLKTTSYFQNVFWWLPIWTMCLEKFVYTYVVWYTSSFTKFAESLTMHPYFLMWSLFWAIKFVGYAAIAIAYANIAPAVDPFTIPTWQIVCSLVWITIGQILNSAVYKALGEVGVLYGAFLGHKIPWVEGFPYTVCPDPQYMGCVFSWWGLLLLTNTDAHAEGGWLVYGPIYMSIYLWQSYAESVSRVPQNPYRAPKHLRTSFLSISKMLKIC